MKRVLSCVITAALLIALLLTGTVVFAQGDPHLEVSAAEGTAGEQVTVTVSLKNSPGFGGMAYDMYYDNTVLRLVSYDLDLGSAICTDSGMDIYEDRMNFQYAHTANVTGDGTLVTLTFEIIAENPCTTEIRIIPEEGTTFYYEGRKEIDFNLASAAGIITVHAAPCAHNSKTEVSALDPDCVNPGNHLYYICKDCGIILKADGITETTEAAEVIPALGHDLSEATCTAPATCRREGCGYTEGESLEHTFTEYVSNNDATCVEDGTETSTCEHCDETNTRTDVGSREDADHSFPEEFTSDHNATCTADGTKSRACTLCGEKETVADEGSMLEHDYQNGVCTGCGQAEFTVLLGDVNGDGDVDTTDAYLIVMYYNEKLDLTEEQLLAADVDGNGEVDTTDAYYIVMYYNEKIDSFPAEQ